MENIRDFINQLAQGNIPQEVRPFFTSKIYSNSLNPLHLNQLKE